MSGEFEAGGDLATGMLSGRAVEPSHGEKGGHGAGTEHGEACLNCGATIAGQFCSDCGQSAHVHRSFSAIGHDLMHGVLHIEGKIWHTLPELFRRPGKLTRRYIDGERAKFVSPLALFLFSAFLMYAVYSLTGSHEEKSAEEQALEEKYISGEARDKAVQELERELAEARDRVTILERDLKAPNLAQTDRAELEEELVAAKATENENQRVVDLQRTFSGDGDNPISNVIAKARENPELVYYKLKANAYKYSWMLIVISLPFMWLLFPFSKTFKMYDHAVYTTYSITFMSFLFSWMMLNNYISTRLEIVNVGLFFYACWHMYRQLKDTYGLSRTTTLLRLPALYVFALTSLLIFFIVLTLM